MYESTIKAYQDLKDRGIEAHSEQWKREIAEVLARQKEAMHPRLFPEMPQHRYVSFYPMDRRRGEARNWYSLPIEERARQMNEHGLIGRRYAGEVRQIITGSIGFDDWEWGVDLFANDPLVFKKLIYEMRFDEVSAVYALFGQFYLGVRVSGGRVGQTIERRYCRLPREALDRKGRQESRKGRKAKPFATFAVFFATFAVIFWGIPEHTWQPLA